jgi:hypothetical protein
MHKSYPSLCSKRKSSSVFGGIRYFHFSESFQPHYGPGVDLAPNEGVIPNNPESREWPDSKSNNFAAICESVF